MAIGEKENNQLSMEERKSAAKIFLLWEGGKAVPCVSEENFKSKNRSTARGRESRGRVQQQKAKEKKKDRVCYLGTK